MGFDLIKHIVNEKNNEIVIWIFNIGVEKYWNVEYSCVKNSKGDIIVNHSEEMMLLLARKGDYVILRKKPSEFYLNNFKKYKKDMPNILYPKLVNEDKSITEIILDDYDLISKIKFIQEKNKNVYLVPYGVTYNEEKLAKLCHLTLIGNSSKKCRKLNDKVLARVISKDLGFNTTNAILCKNFDEIKEFSEKMLSKYKKIVIKTPYNASGKGMWIVDSNQKYNVTLKVIKRYIRKNPNTQWLIEEWVDNKIDLNYQIYISETGDVNVFSIKEQILQDTVYIGSYIPPRINSDMYFKFIKYGENLGKYLFKKGYKGVFGIDALVINNIDTVPILEINCRFTLSTYIYFFEMLYKDKRIFSFYVNISTTKTITYSQILKIFEKKLLMFDGEKGVICYVEATVDSKLADGYSRIFLVLIGDNEEDIKKQYYSVNNILKSFIS